MGEAGKVVESGARVGPALGAVPTTAMASATGNAMHAELALLLAETAAGVRGAEARLALHLHPPLRSMLRSMLRKPRADGTPTMLSDAGALVQALWRRSVHGEEGHEGDKGDSGDDGGSADAPGRTTDATARALHLLYLEQAARVMQGLTQALAARSTPAANWGPTLRALETLSVAEPRLARVARLRWFAGLGVAEIAAVLDESELEVQRAWRKARAFLAVAATAPAVPVAPAAPAAPSAPKRRGRRANPAPGLDQRP